MTKRTQYMTAQRLLRTLMWLDGVGLIQPQRRLRVEDFHLGAMVNDLFRPDAPPTPQPPNYSRDANDGYGIAGAPKGRWPKGPVNVYAEHEV